MKAPEISFSDFCWGSISTKFTWSVFDADSALAPRGICRRIVGTRNSRPLNISGEAASAAAEFKKYGSKVTVEELVSLAQKHG